MPNISKKEKLILVAILVLIVLIPTTSYFIANSRTQTKTNASDGKDKFLPLPVTSPRAIPKGNELLKETEASSSSDNSPTERTVAPILGPTLDFQIIIEGRPASDQSGKVFVGIAEGAQASDKPKYLLSFVVNVPATGEYKGLSLAGLEEGSNYTAYLKGPAQIATSSAFVVNPTPTNLGKLNMITGDVNEDNLINQSDYDIVKAAIGTTPTSSGWNANLDFNLDKIVNSWDLSYVSKNMAKSGSSGVWYSKPPVTSSSSGALIDEVGKSSGGPENVQIRNVPPDKREGYWMWFPAL